MERTTAKKNKYEIDMCNGTIMDKLISFSLPLMLSGILQLMFNAVDIIVVGRFSGSQALAAVGSTSALINVFTNLFIGISLGANVLTARFYAAGREKEVSETVHTAITLALVSGIVMALVGLVFSRGALALMGTPDDVIGLSALYMRIYFLGMPFFMLYNYGAAILRAVGDTKRPLLFLMIAGVINACLNMVLVIVFKLGVAGVAIATVMAETVSAFLACMTLTRTDGAHKLVLRDLHINKTCLGEIFRIGLPAGVQQGLTAFSNALVQAYVNGLGSSVIMAGWSCHSKIDQFAILPAQSMGQAATTFVGQNLGAKNVKRARKGVRQAVFMGVGALICTSIVMALSARSLVSLFNRDPSVLHYGTLFILMTVPFRFCSSFNQILAGSLRGSGDAKGPMCIMLFSFVVCRQIYLFFVTKIAFNEYTVGLGYPVGWIVCAVISYFYYKKSRWEEQVEKEA